MKTTSAIEPTQQTDSGAIAIVPAPARLPVGTMVGDWRIDALIGEGGMGTVYAAVHAIIGKQAALKVVRADRSMSDETQTRLVVEAQIVNQIRHPNIVDIFHIGQLSDGRIYLVMELLRGRTLGDLLRESTPSTAEAINILLQVTDALAAAHACGVVHCDLKPDNIFLADTHAGTVVKLLDWGIARLIGGPKRPTGEGVVGTPRHLSPEQARGESLDPRTDIYSLGTIAYQLFLGRPPFLGDDALALVTMQLTETPPAPRSLEPDLSPALEQLLLGMLAKKAAYRPCLTEVTSTLLEVLQRELPLPAEAIEVRDTPATPRRRPRHAVKIALAVTVLVAGLALIRPGWWEEGAPAAAATLQDPPVPLAPRPPEVVLPLPTMVVPAATPALAPEHKERPSRRRPSARVRADAFIESY